MIFSMKSGDCFSNLLGIKRMKYYLDLLRFDISIIQCLVVYFFTRHSVE